MNTNLKEVENIKQSTASIPISASTLLTSLSIEKPKYILKIRGEVLDIRPFSKENELICYYGEIGDNDGAIEFKIKPTDKLKARGQHIEITGSIKVNPSTFNSSLLKVTIDGEISGEYEPNLTPIVKPIDYNSRGKLQLTQFLEKYDVEKLCLLSTKTAANDFRSACNQPAMFDRITQVECKFNNLENIIEGIKKASELKYIEGIMITRGGSKHSTDMRIWNKPEIVDALMKSNRHFYVAVGHSDQLVLADKHSDQFFDTPYDLGASFASAINDINTKNALINKINYVERELANVTPSLNHKQSVLKKSIIINIVLVIVIAVLIKFF